MKKIVILLLILIFVISKPAQSASLKKDYKQKFLDNAIKAEKRKQYKSAFFNYEKLIFYYPNDENSLNKYGEFCEKNNFPDKAVEIYSKLYLLTKNPKYLEKIRRIAPLTEKEKQNKRQKETKDKENKLTTKQKQLAEQKTKAITKPKSKAKTDAKSSNKKIYESKEILMYKALKVKNYQLAETYLFDLLKKYPQNLKYITLMSDIALAKKDYPLAIKYLERQKLTDEKMQILAFCYYETYEFEKALSIINRLIEKNPQNIDYISTAIGYSFGADDLNKVLFYLEKGLLLDKENTTFLEQKSDLLAQKKQYKEAIIPLEKLVEISPKKEYKLKLTDLYLATNDYKKAEETIAPLYSENKDDKNIAKKYLHILVTQDKNEEAYKVASENNLLDSKEANLVAGHLSRKNADYQKAKEYYQKVLDKEPNNISAQIGSAYASLESKDFTTSRNKFEKILEVNPSFVPARLGIVDSYMANAEDFKTLGELEKMPQSDKVSLLKAQTYFQMRMYENAKNSIRQIDTPEAIELKNEIQRAQAYIFNPSYDLFIQKLSEEFKLNYNKIGFRNSKYIDNLNYYTDYNIIIYSSGRYKDYSEGFNNVTNEIRGGVEGRINKNTEIKLDIGAKIFQNEGAMLNTDSWVRYYPSDKYNIKLGFYRDNVQQSYLSAVGTYVNNVYTGQVSNNKVYSEFDLKLPKNYYSFGRGGFGLMYGQNLRTNPYWEGMLGLGNLLYYTSAKAKIKKVSADIVSYNAGYRYDLLNIFDNHGDVFGGYWSPNWFSANTVNLNILGEYKKINYGIAGYSGWQYTLSPHQSLFIWGANAFVNWKINQHSDLNFAYRYFNYADVQRNQFIVNLIIRGFKRVKTN